METGQTFESALAELEQIVQRLQRADIPLDDAMALYRRGTELAKRTEELLSTAEMQVQQLTIAVRERFIEYAIDSEDGEDA